MPISQKSEVINAFLNRYRKSRDNDLKNAANYATNRQLRNIEFNSQYHRFKDTLGLAAANLTRNQQYNSHALGNVHAFEGAAPKPNRAAQANHFFENLMQNQIKAHIGAGNPLSGYLDHKSSVLSEKGFIDLSFIPQSVYDTPQDVEKIKKEKENFFLQLRRNPIVQSYLTEKYGKEESSTRKYGANSFNYYSHLNLLESDPLIAQLVDNHFQLFENLFKEHGLRFTSKLSMNDTTGTEEYEVTIHSGKNQPYTYHYLTLSQWEDFATATFNSEQFKALYDFHLANNIVTGVNCAAGVGRSGVIALAFYLADNNDEQQFIADGIINFEKVDQVLSSFRLSRSMLIQTSDQYLMAVTLASSFVLRKKYSRDLTDKDLQEIAITTEEQLAKNCGITLNLAKENELFTSANQTHSDSEEWLHFHTETNTGIAEFKNTNTRTQGKQEDYVNAGKINDFSSLSEPEQNTVLKNLTTHLQNKIVRELPEISKKVGSTFSCNIVSRNQLNQLVISGVDVGDSRRFVVIFDAKGRPKSCVRLNQSLHNLDNQHELNRIKQHDIAAMQAVIKSGVANDFDILDPPPPSISLPGHPARLRSGLAVSRGLGDLDDEQVGLIHEGTPTYYRLQLEEGEKAIVLTTCDGAVEGMENESASEEAQAMLSIFADMGDSDDDITTFGLDRIAATVINAAKDNGTTDNVSVLAMMIDPATTLVGNEKDAAIYNAVFDGHKGGEVAKIASQHLHKELQLTLQLRKTAAQQPSRNTAWMSQKLAVEPAAKSAPTKIAIPDAVRVLLKSLKIPMPDNKLIDLKTFNGLTDRARTEANNPFLNPLYFSKQDENNIIAAISALQTNDTTDAEDDIIRDSTINIKYTLQDLQKRYATEQLILKDIMDVAKTFSGKLINRISFDPEDNLATILKKIDKGDNVYKFFRLLLAKNYDKSDMKQSYRHIQNQVFEYCLSKCIGKGKEYYRPFFNPTLAATTKSELLQQAEANPVKAEAIANLAKYTKFVTLNDNSGPENYLANLMQPIAVVIFQSESAGKRGHSNIASELRLMVETIDKENGPKLLKQEIDKLTASNQPDQNKSNRSSKRP